MKQYCLKIVSKNEKSLRNFLFFFSNHLKNKFNIIQKLVATPNSKQRITLLKSPHVNKIAQEQFEMRIFTKQILTKSFYLEKSIILLKKVLNKLFQDISIHIEYTTNKNIKSKTKALTFYPDNFKLPSQKQHKANLQRTKRKNKLKIIKPETKILADLAKLLKILSIFGEIITVHHLDLFFRSHLFITNA